MTLAVRQGSPEWLEARRALVTATDIPVLLGLSPYKSEADLADEKLTGSRSETTLRMRAGTALEPLIAEAYTETTGRRLRRYGILVTHPDLTWAGCSPDFRALGERRLVETKWTTSRGRFADGLPQDVEAQAIWQLGVTGYPVADVAVLTPDELLNFEVAADAETFANLVAVAEDFRGRLERGGPFAHSAASVKRAYPRDDGSDIQADTELNDAIHRLLALRDERTRLKDAEEVIETAVKARMGTASRLLGDGFTVSWKQTKDREVTDWKSLAAGLLRKLAPDQRDALVGLHTAQEPGYRPFRVVTKGDTE